MTKSTLVRAEMQRANAMRRQKIFDAYSRGVKGPALALEHNISRARVYQILRAVMREVALSECDCCGKMKPNCRDTVAFGLDTHVCEDCCDGRNPAADRGDHLYHTRDRD